MNNNSPVNNNSRALPMQEQMALVRLAEERKEESGESEGSSASQGTTINDLPREVLEIVFRFVDARTLRVVPGICRYWNEVFKNAPTPDWIELCVKSIPRHLSSAFDSTSAPDTRLMLLKFWNEERKGYEAIVEEINPFAPARFIESMERKEKRWKDEGLIAFCRVLPLQVQASLTSLNAVLPLAVKADALRRELNNNPVVQNLRQLDLVKKNLQFVPEELRYFRNLQSINLYKTELIEIHPNAFQGLVFLREINLSGNKLTELPEKLFEGLRDLQKINLGHNNITQLPEKLFEGLAALQTLDLANNKVTVLPEKLFEGLAALQTLDLANNKVTVLPEKLFKGLIALQDLSLHLCINQIAAIHPNTFQDLIFLREVNLSSNKLTELPEKLFEGLRDLPLYWTKNKFMSRNSLILNTKNIKVVA